eukprot:EG_transcript_21816
MSFPLLLLSLFLSTTHLHYINESAEVSPDPNPNPSVAAFAPAGIDFYYINMNRSAARRRHMLRQFAALGIVARRWPGVVVPPTAEEVQRGLRGEPGLPRARQRMTAAEYAGTLGCRRSHQTLLRHLAHRDPPHPGHWHMVFEDDLTLPRNLFVQLLPFLQRVPDDWDVIRFDCDRDELERADPTFYDIVAPDVYRVHRGNWTSCAETGQQCWLCGGTHTVVFRQRAVAAALQAFADQADRIHVDCILSRVGKPHGPLGSYCVQTGLIDNWSGFKSDREGPR